MAARGRPAGVRADDAVEAALSLGLDHVTMSVHDAAVVLDSIADMTADSFVTTRAMDAGDDIRRRRVERVRNVTAGTSVAGLAPDDLIAEMRDAVGTADDPRHWWSEKLALLLDGVDARLQRAAEGAA